MQSHICGYAKDPFNTYMYKLGYLASGGSGGAGFEIEWHMISYGGVTNFFHSLVSMGKNKNEM